MIPGVTGKTVAVIGRAESLQGSGLGSEIDAADVVVRVNWVLPLDAHLAEHVGTRTDVVYHCKGCRQARDRARDLGVTTVKVDRELRKSLARQANLPKKHYRPLTGTVAVYDAFREMAGRIRIYGMDFQATGHVAGQPSEVDVTRLKRKHAPAEDARLIRELCIQVPHVELRGAA